jgi:hypothetical protein
MTQAAADRDATPTATTVATRAGNPMTPLLLE